MTASDAARFGWDCATPIVGFVMFVAVVLLGFALLREISR